VTQFPGLQAEGKRLASYES